MRLVLSVLVIVFLISCGALWLLGCANSLPLGQQWVECDKTYPQPVWTGQRWVECV